MSSVLEYFKVRWPFPPMTRVMLRGRYETIAWDGYFTGGIVRLTRGGTLYLQIVWLNHPSLGVEDNVDLFGEGSSKPQAKIKGPPTTFGEIDKTTTEPFDSVIEYFPPKVVHRPKRLVLHKRVEIPPPRNSGTRRLRLKKQVTPITEIQVPKKRLKLKKSK